MEKQEIVANAKRLLKTHQNAFVMGTVSPEGRPHVFYIGRAVVEEPFTLYIETFTDSRKVKNITSNPNIELVIAAPEYAEVATIGGTAAMEESPQKKRQVWEAIHASSDYFASPDSPDFGVIKITVKSVQLQERADNPREMFVAVL